METYVNAKELVSNPNFTQQRQRALDGLDLALIDKPIIDLIAGIAKIPYCFTQQSCYGHFLHAKQRNPKNIAPLPTLEDGEKVDFRIAYLAFCVENNEQGRDLLNDLSELRSIDPQYVQFASAEWFWDQQVNSYIVQVEPERYKAQDRCMIEYQEAIQLEQSRDRFFEELEKMVAKRI